jgi:hypothetical protein
MKNQARQETDSILLEAQADAAGLTLNQYLEFDRLKTENAKLKKSKTKKMFGVTFFIFLSVFVATLGVYIWIYTFRPYYKYDKVVLGSSSYVVRTNLVTGQSERLNSHTMIWEDYRDLDR